MEVLIQIGFSWSWNQEMSPISGAFWHGFRLYFCLWFYPNEEWVLHLQFHVFFFSFLRKNGPRIIVCSIYWSLSSYCFCTLVGQVLQTLRIPYTNLLVNVHSFLGFLAYGGCHSIIINAKYVELNWLREKM